MPPLLGGLGNAGEWLRLVNAEGTILSSFRYDDSPPWPVEADGDRPSLQLSSLRPDVDYSNHFSWIAIRQDGSLGDTAPGFLQELQMPIWTKMAY